MKRLLQLALLSLLVTSAWAQAPPRSTASGSGSGCKATPLSITVSTVSGSLVVLLAGVGSSTGNFTISDSASQTWTATPAGKIVDTGQGIGGEIWYVPNSAALTSVTIKTSTASNCSGVFLEYTGMATSTPLDIDHGQDNSTAGTTCPSGSVTITNASDVIIGHCFSNVSSYTAGGTGCTYTVEKSQTAAVPTEAGQDCNASATGSFQSSFSIASSRSIGFITAFKQSGGAAPSCANFIALLGAGCK